MQYFQQVSNQTIRQVRGVFGPHTYHCREGSEVKL
jgi:hypothetical protein